MAHFDPLNSKFARNIHFFIKKIIYRNLKKKKKKKKMLQHYT
jgi:hypothetical protein